MTPVTKTLTETENGLAQVPSSSSIVQIHPSVMTRDERFLLLRYYIL